MGYSIEELSRSNISRWDAFNRDSKEGTLFHGIPWKMLLEEAFDVKTRYYLILEGQKVVGICPFIERSEGFFRGLTGIPHSECNNVILDESFRIDRIDDLLALLSQNYSFLHLNTSNPCLLDRITYDNFREEESGNMILDLKKYPPETIWEDFLSGEDRRKIRRFEKKGFKVRGITEQGDLERFYHYYAENLARINGEILPFAFIQRLVNTFTPGGHPKTLQIIRAQARYMSPRNECS